MCILQKSHAYFAEEPLYDYAAKCELQAAGFSVRVSEWFAAHTYTFTTSCCSAHICSRDSLQRTHTHSRLQRTHTHSRLPHNAQHTLIDFKMNLVYTTDLDQLHERVAKRWYDVCCQNAGLYIKIGQQVRTYKACIFRKRAVSTVDP